MTELTHGPIVRVGVDLSKRLYQVHAVDQWGPRVLAKSLPPERFRKTAWWSPKPAVARTTWQGSCGPSVWMLG